MPSTLVLVPLDDSLANLVKTMKVSEMLLWILGTTLLAFFFGAHYWGEHQRREGWALFAEVQRPATVGWMSDAHAGDAVPVGLPSPSDEEAA